MRNLTVSMSPHIANPRNSTRRIMADVLIALIPCVLAATYFFGYHVIINILVCAATCFGAEILFNLLYKGFRRENVKQSGAFDCSCLVTGVILALNLPAKVIIEGWNFNFYADGFRLAEHAAEGILFSFDVIVMCVIGSVFAIMLVKMLFGGIGRNFANPAATARIFLMFCFGLAAINSAGLGLTPSAGATWLSGTKSTANQSMFLQMLIGNRGTAAVGETSMIAVLLGGIYLSVRKVIDFRIPLIGLFGFALFALVFDGILARNLLSQPMAGAKLVNNIAANVMAGGFIFGLIFMATDYSSTPTTFSGHAVFILGYAFLTVLIRSFAAFPEGASFALLLMNMVTPIIDRYMIPKPFGYQRPRKARPKENSGEVRA